MTNALGDQVSTRDYNPTGYPTMLLPTQNTHQRFLERECIVNCLAPISLNMTLKDRPRVCSSGGYRYCPSPQPPPSVTGGVPGCFRSLALP